MKNVSKLVVRMGLLSLLSVMPLAAQIDNGVNFTTSFPFYAGNAKMPAGSYKITQSDMDASILQIQSNDGVHSALVEFIPIVSPKNPTDALIMVLPFPNASQAIPALGTTSLHVRML